MKGRIPSTRSECEVLPHLFGDFHGKSQTTHGAQANRVVDDMNVDVAHVGEAALDESTESLDGGTATGEDHVLTELVVVFGVGSGNEFLDVLYPWVGGARLEGDAALGRGRPGQARLLELAGQFPVHFLIKISGKCSWGFLVPPEAEGK